MILISRLLTYLIALIYFICSLIWLVNPASIYWSTLLVFALVLLFVYLILSGQFKLFSWLNELIYPVLYLVVTINFLVFLPNNWLYFVAVILFSLGLFVLLNDSFHRYNPYLGKYLKFELDRQLMFMLGLIFIICVVGYNFILFLNWQLVWTMIAIFLFLILLWGKLVKWTADQELMFTFVILLLSTLELYFVFYYLPLDIYLKSLLVTINAFLLIKIFFMPYFNQITRIYDNQEK